MALRALRINNDPILRKHCREVAVVDDKIRSILDDMVETLHATKNGAALAAPQVGILKRLVVIDMGELSGGVLKLVNPKVVSQEGSYRSEEGCLSFPDRWAETIRPYFVTVEAQDEQGNHIVLKGEGEMAKCFCHEIDHLDGIVFFDHAIAKHPAEKPRSRKAQNRR